MDDPTIDTRDRPATGRGRLILGLALGLAGAVGAWLDHSTGWIDAAFDAVAHQFYEVPVLERLRRPSQLALVRMHLAVLVGLASLGLVASGRLGRHGRGWWAVFVLAYAIRALAWTAGGNLPLVPGDSCHYVEIATSIVRGEGPVKHYVESFFDRLSAGSVKAKPVLDDWATPLDAYIRAATFRLTWEWCPGPIARSGPSPRPRGCSFVDQSPVDLARAVPGFALPTIRARCRSCVDGRPGDPAGPCDLRRASCSARAWSRLTARSWRSGP